MVWHYLLQLHCPIPLLWKQQSFKNFRNKIFHGKFLVVFAVLKSSVSPFTCTVLLVSFDHQTEKKSMLNSVSWLKVGFSLFFFSIDKQPGVSLSHCWLNSSSVTFMLERKLRFWKKKHEFRLFQGYEKGSFDTVFPLFSEGIPNMGFQGHSWLNSVFSVIRFAVILM